MVMNKEGRVVHVDGNNMVLVEIPHETFSRAEVAPVEFAAFLRPGSGDTHQVKLGAAGVRYLGDVAKIGRDPRAWPTELPFPLVDLVVRALPFAKVRVDALRSTGTRAPYAVYSNDLARVKGDDPVKVSVDYGASAQSSREYESLVRSIKSGSGSDSEKAEKLGGVILVLGSKLADQRTERTRDGRWKAASNARDLGPLARQFIESSETMAKYLAYEVDLDWSGVTIGVCKAFECESIARVIDPLRTAVDPATLELDIKDSELRSIARYCSGASEIAPELGTIGRFLQTAAHSKRRAESSALLKAFRAQLGEWPSSDWLLSDDGGITAFANVTRRFRNRAAHLASLTRTDYEDCHHLVLGPGGILWELVRATSPRPESTQTA